MRTTLTLDDEAAARQQPGPRTISHSFGFRPGIDPDKLGQVADELEAEDLSEKLILS